MKLIDFQLIETGLLAYIALGLIAVASLTSKSRSTTPASHRTSFTTQPHTHSITHYNHTQTHSSPFPPTYFSLS